VSGLWIAALVSLWLIVAVLALLVLGLLRRIAPILERTEAAVHSPTSAPGLPPGNSLPAFDLTTADGKTMAAASLLGQPFVLFLVRSGCAPCRKLAEDVREADFELPVELLVVADDGDGEADIGEWPSPATLVYQRDHEVSRALATFATPHAFAVDAYGTIVATGFPDTLDRLQVLARKALEGGDARQAVSRHAVLA
jgi:AhpC/TSA family